MWSNFHFLQPYWLLLLPLIILLALSIKRSNLNRTHWSKVCDPELLPFLEQQGETEKYRVFPLLVFIAALFLVMAAAQPVWQQMPQPVFKKNDAVVIALDLSASMNATDLKPSRLQRARFKVKDLLARIPDAHVSLIVYAADAFIVTPLTEDADNVLDQLPAMSPEIMPVQGSRPDKALLKADQVLTQAGINKGNIVLISDEVLPGQVAKTAAELRSGGRQISILAVGTEQGAPIPQNGVLITDRQGKVVVAKTRISDMQEAASIGGGHAVLISPDDRDVSYLVNRFQKNNQIPAETAQLLNLWVAEGPWLVLLALPLLLPLFRRGILNLLLPAVFFVSSSLSPDLYAESETETAGGLSREKAIQFWQNLWQTSDQQAYQMYQTGDTGEAAERFKDPRWKQASHYQSGAYENALAALEKPETSTDWYNRGNTLARMGKLEEAIKAYDEALKQNPKFEDANYNRRLLEDLKQEQQEQQQSSKDDKQSEDNDSQKNSQQQQNGDSSQQDQQQSQGEGRESGSSENNQESDSSKQQAQSNQSSDAGSETNANNSDQQGNEQDSTEQMKQQLKDKMDQQLSEQESKSSQQSGSENLGEPSQQNQTRSVQPNSEPIDEENAAREQLLNRIEDDPAGLWRRKFIYQYRQQADGQAVEDQQW